MQKLFRLSCVRAYLAYSEPDYNSNRYSLSNYGGTGRAVGNVNYQTDIPAGAGVALFSSSTTFNAATRLDSVGFGGVTDALYFEGTALAPNGGITAITEHSFIRKLTGGRPQDTNNNAADFVLISTTGLAGATQTTLGAPGPENLSSLIERSFQFSAAPLDPQQPSTASPNRSRDLSADPANCSQFGTMTIRRTFTNNTGAALTRLRFRIMDMTTFPVLTPGAADIRARTIASSNVTVTGGASLPVSGTTLETPPAQPFCGGLNSSLIVLNTPLAAGASINVQFLVGVQQTGRFRFIVIIETTP